MAKINRLTWTQAPNEFFDDTKDLSNAEFRVLGQIVRKTMGWHNEWDFISLNEIRQKTNLSIPAIIKATKKLKEDGWILIAYGCSKCNLFVEDCKFDFKCPRCGTEQKPNKYYCVDIEGEDMFEYLKKKLEFVEFPEEKKVKPEENNAPPHDTITEDTKLSLVGGSKLSLVSPPREEVENIRAAGSFSVPKEIGSKEKDPEAKSTSIVHSKKDGAEKKSAAGFFLNGSLEKKKKQNAEMDYETLKQLDENSRQAILLRLPENRRQELLQRLEAENVNNVTS